MALLLAAGCGGAGLYPVEGQVVFADGTPLKSGTVVFSSVDQQVLIGARGELKDGAFRASTYRLNDGAPPGTYTVMVTTPAGRDLTVTSGARYTVKAGKNEFLTITVEKPKGSKGPP
jgi:hypothetical protein